VLPVETGDQVGQQPLGGGRGQGAFGRQFRQQRPGPGRQRIPGPGQGAGHGLLEARAEPLRMELAEEKLGDVLGQVLVRVGAAGEGDPVQGVDLRAAVAQRHQQARDGGLAGRQGAGRGLHRAQGAVVEEDLPPGRHAVPHVGPGVGHAPLQVVEQEQVHGHGQLGPGNPGASGAFQGGGHGHRPMQITGPALAGHRLDQGPQVAFREIHARLQCPTAPPCYRASPAAARSSSKLQILPPKALAATVAGLPSHTGPGPLRPG